MTDSQEQKSISDLSTRPIGRLLWEYSMPAIVGMVVMSLYNVIDRIFIGRGVGAEAIAGLAITFPVMNISAAIGVLIGAGAAARVSIMLGQRDRRSAEEVLGNSTVLILVNAIVYLTFFAIFLDDILRLFGASDITLPYAHDFMAYLLPGMLIMNVMYSLNNVMRATGYPKQAMITMFIGAGCNVVLAPIFIFVLDLGIKGAAIATDISMTVGMIFVLAHFFNKKSTVHFRRGIYRLKWRIIIGIIGIGAAPSIINAASCAINILINRTLVDLGGDLAVGAAGIFSTFTSLLCMVVVGLCQGVQPILGYNYGAGHIDRMKRAFWLSVMIATAVTTAGCIFGLFTPKWIALAFTDNPELISVTVNSLEISMLAFWAVGFQIVSTTLFQSIGMAGKSIFLSLIRQVIFLIPLLITLPKAMGLDGVWASFPTSDAFATVVTLVMVIWQLRRMNRQHALKPME
ncbi:MATE family efflux transporter [Muribaculum intestinale]|uniref:Multidrug export protein MepA n=2 Tax=Muribaculum intestinale TaxID=1796646 RepID=A0A4S2G1N8_9BACT|nr:MATE family efflux transporter [Muribaculum intestinale]MYM11769.1 MATE family efflux transporter [Muribaculum intestinale]TGY75804.1 MATE family efflux transporter [Muribaculum intestinale]